jgi:hypothetical protein
MSFWDSSAVAALFLRQGETTRLRALARSERPVVAWTMTEIEFHSALCRILREGVLTPDAAEDATRQFEGFWEKVRIVSAVDAVKERARRLLSVHPLRAADALQLGAALVSTYDRPTRREFVALDARVAGAARREGFRVLP